MMRHRESTAWGNCRPSYWNGRHEADGGTRVQYRSARAYDQLVDSLREFAVAEFGQSHSYLYPHNHEMTWMRIYGDK
jgi:hypothetical protein